MLNEEGAASVRRKGRGDRAREGGEVCVHCWRILGYRSWTTQGKPGMRLGFGLDPLEIV